METTKLTITEALAEIQTIAKRVAKKETALDKYITRHSRVTDPISEEGGSQEHLRKEFQAIADLRNRSIRLRHAIQACNVRESMTVLGKTYTVSEWLTWKREHAQDVTRQLERVRSIIAQARDAFEKALRNKPDDEPEFELLVNVDEKALDQDLDEKTQMYGKLDGARSLFNATHTIEVPQ